MAARQRTTAIRCRFPNVLSFIIPTLTFGQVTCSMFTRLNARQVPVSHFVLNHAPPPLSSGTPVLSASILAPQVRATFSFGIILLLFANLECVP